jgi:phage terminase large subunit-like protein
VWRWCITEGVSLWDGYGLDICENEINRFGPASFLRESQNDVDGDVEGALMSAADFDRTRVASHPELARIAVAVDPPGGATECGIVCGGRARIGNDWHGYTLEDATQPKGVKPEVWALEVLKCYYRHSADVIFVERNYGGDMVSSTLRLTKWLDDDGKVILDGSKVRVEEVTATRGKLVRAEPIATAFQQGRIHHVGAFDAMEKEWRQYVPGVKDSPNRLDAEVWLMSGLELVGTQAGLQIQPQATNLYGSRETVQTRGTDRRGLHGSRT